MVRGLRRGATALAAVVMMCAGAWAAPGTAAAAEARYQIYPTPHAVEYAEGSVKFEGNVTSVVEDGIDADTVARLDEVAKLKGVKLTKADAVPNAGTAVLVGIKGSGKAVDTYVDGIFANHELSYTNGLFNHTDSYTLAVLPAKGGAPARIIVLGKDSDAAYYGLTTLYQILQQVEGSSVRALVASDYADVITRGFIEGYYGNPWSTEDRVELMRWGGYYKLNAYFYAPKDDPKHNRQWKTPYTETELKDKIEPLAKAGNESKCRFVFALHPFMKDPIKNNNYNQYVGILKTKFTQVMDHGVRQIAILADDADDQGQQLYTKLCNDMTDWLHEQQKAVNADGSLKYPGLKDTLIFCPVKYMGNGEYWYRNLPSNVQVINTGGRVWGKIDRGFATTFKNTSGVAPFMWINWPCSDNDKNALHMGGHNNFLGADLQPDQVKGVVLNPMQQSEPSKQGIFMNADLTWNLWTSTAHADKVWSDSFSYIDHNSALPTKGSDALRELSGHMKRMFGGGVTWENDESADIRAALAGFRSKMTADTVTKQDCDDLEKILKKLQTTAKTYRDNAGTEAMLKQMEPWMSTWDDLTRAALVELDAVRASIDGDGSLLVAKYAEGTGLLEQANGHALWYVDHYEYARVGKAHITPLIMELDQYAAEKASLAADPDAVLTKLVTNRADSPVGSVKAVFDGKDNTGAEYHDPNKVAAGDYFGMTRSKPFDVASVRFVQGGGKNFMDASKVQYLQGGEWKDVPGAQEYTTRVVVVNDLDLKQVDGVRLVAVRNNALDAWPTINEIQVNRKVDVQGVFTGTVTLAHQESADTSKPLQNASDAKSNTEAWFTHKKSQPNKHDATIKDAAVQVTFDNPRTIDAIVFQQGGGSSTDVIDEGKAFWQGADDAWHEAGSVNQKKEQVVKLAGPVEAKAIKVVNGKEKPVWWRVVDLYATHGKAPANPRVATNLPQYQNYSINNVIDGNDESKFFSSRATQVGDYVILGFGESKFIDSVRMLQDSGDNFPAADIFYTTDATPSANGSWTKVAVLQGASEQTVSFERVEATGIKVAATQGTNKWFQLFELNAFERYAFTKDNLVASVSLDGVDIAARVGGGAFKTGSADIVLPKRGDVVAVDLGSVTRDVALANADEQPLDGVELVYSQNALEWVPAQGGGMARAMFASYRAAQGGPQGDPDRARFVGYRATKDNARIGLRELEGTYLDTLAPSLVSSDLAGGGSLKIGAVFDGDVSTKVKFTSGPARDGDTVVFDLGQQRFITSLDYFVPETSKDFIRNAVIEVADDVAGPWTEVLDLNSKNIIPNGQGSDQSAKESGLYTHSSEFPGNMAKSATGLDVSGRFMRIRFTGAYTDRWVEIGDLRINGGEYVTTYAGGDFESTALEQRGKTPGNLTDKSLITSWVPQGTEAGELVYHVSTPLKADGSAYAAMRVVSGSAQDSVKVKAVVYTDGSYSAHKTATVELGGLDTVLKEMEFGPRAVAVKDIMFEWPEGTTPKISEIYLLGAVSIATPEEVGRLRSAVEEAKRVDASAWTADSQAALAAAIAQADEALLDEAHLTSGMADALIESIRAAVDSPVLKYAGTELGDLVDGALTDGSKFTPATWRAYRDALDAARDALNRADNLSQAEGEQLAADLQAALDGLARVDIAGGSSGSGGPGGSSSGGTAGGSSGFGGPGGSSSGGTASGTPGSAGTGGSSSGGPASGTPGPGNAGAGGSASGSAGSGGPKKPAGGLPGTGDGSKVACLVAAAAVCTCALGIAKRREG